MVQTPACPTTLALQRRQCLGLMPASKVCVERLQGGDCVFSRIINHHAWPTISLYLCSSLCLRTKKAARLAASLHSL